MLRMFDDHEYREIFRRTVDRELAAVKRVIEDLRQLARPPALQRTPVDVSESVLEVVESMRPAAEEAELSLLVTPASEPLLIEGDRMALGRVYRNVLSNAIQATPPGGRIAITIAERGERVHVSVADTGCGIPADRLPAIFNDFITTKRRGLGLGFAISKKIVEQLNGRITVSSEVRRGDDLRDRFSEGIGVLSPSGPDRLARYRHYGCATTAPHTKTLPTRQRGESTRLSRDADRQDVSGVTMERLHCLDPPAQRRTHPRGVRHG